MRKRRYENFFSGDLYLGGFMLEMRGEGDLSVGGCRSIAEYSTERIVLLTSSGHVVVCGRDLYCDSFLGGAVGVRGKITKIEFEGKRREATDDRCLGG